MISKTQQEKEAAKNAKKAWKQRNKREKEWLDEVPERLDIKISPASNIILTGIVDGERILEDDYIVYAGYTYVIDDNGGKVIISGIHGTIKDLKKDIQTYTEYSANNIYNCHRKNRNIQ